MRAGAAAARAVAGALGALTVIGFCWGALSRGSAQVNGKESAPDWAGTWYGTMVILPPKERTPVVEVKREVGAFPARDGATALWRTTYSEAGKVNLVKDYRLVRGKGDDDLAIDEQNGLKLKSRLLGDVLVTPFRYDEKLLISTVRVRGDVMEEEILIMDDKPAAKGVTSLPPTMIQRLVMRRSAR